MIMGERARHSQVCSIENCGYLVRANLSASGASHSLGCSMINRAVYMVESVRTYVANTHAHVRMSVCY